MPQPDNSVPGAPIWIDLMTTDPERAEEFYGELFGWTADSLGDEYGGYIEFRKSGNDVAGAMRSQPDTGPPNVWSLYLMTENAESTAEATKAAGGQVLVAPMQVSDFGSMVVVLDSAGAAVGGWQPGKHRGFQVIGEPGTPSWFELLTRDYVAAVDFYKQVFQWDAHVAGDTDEFRYTTLGSGNSQRAGIMDAAAFLPEDVPPHWSVYFGTDDTDAALRRIENLGGSVILPAETTPYGRMAQVSDPMGAMFKLVDPSTRS